MHKINTFKSPNVSHLIKPHTLSFQGRYHEATSFSWRAFTVFLGTSKDCKTRCRRGHNLLFSEYRAFWKKRNMVPVVSFNTSLPFCKEPPNSSVNSFESLFPPKQRDFQSVFSNCPDGELLSWINQKALTKLKCPYTGDDPPRPVQVSKYKAVFGFGYSVFRLKPQLPSGIYFLRLCNLFFNRLSRRLIRIAGGIFAHRTFNLSPPLSLSSTLFIVPPDGCPFSRNNRSTRCLEPNIMSQKNNAMIYTNIDAGKCVHSGSCKRPQNFIEQKQSYYGSNAKRKKSRFILKIFNQEHLFESLSLRNNSPNELPQTKWFQAFKLLPRETARESHRQRSFNSANSVSLQLVGNAVLSNYRISTIAAVALK